MVEGVQSMPSTRDTTARSRIRRYLRDHGPVEDTGGRATARLMDAVDYQGTAVAFIQLVTAMSKDDEIVRQIRGKRTYRIAQAEPHTAAAGRPAEHLVGDRQAVGAEGADYADVAVRLLAALARQVRANGPAGRDGAVESAEMDELRRESDRLRAERDDYARRLREARRDLAVLIGMPLAGAELDPDIERAARSLLLQLARGQVGGEQTG